MTDPYGLTPEQREAAIDLVLDERAELVVDGVMSVIERSPWFSPRVALALARRLNRLHGVE